jgi:hypothetical protein
MIVTGLKKRAEHLLAYRQALEQESTTRRSCLLRNKARALLRDGD